MALCINTINIKEEITRNDVEFLHMVCVDEYQQRENYMCEDEYHQCEDEYQQYEDEYRHCEDYMCEDEYQQRLSIVMYVCIASTSRQFCMRDIFVKSFLFVC